MRKTIYFIKIKFLTGKKLNFSLGPYTKITALKELSKYIKADYNNEAIISIVPVLRKR